MARRQRIELEGGLYHIIARGNNRQEIFHSPEDHKKFLSLLAVQKEKLPFFLYAYCLMTNHVHLLIERMTDDIGRIMHRVLTEKHWSSQADAWEQVRPSLPTSPVSTWPASADATTPPSAG